MKKLPSGREGNWGQVLTPEWVPLSTGRGTEAFLMGPVGKWGASPRWKSSGTGPRVALRVPRAPLSILISRPEATVLDALPRCHVLYQPAMYLKLRAGNMSAWVNVISWAFEDLFFRRKPVCSFHKQSSGLESSVNWLTASWWCYSVTLTASSRLLWLMCQSRASPLAVLV